MKRTTNSMAIYSMIISILSWCLNIFILIIGSFLSVLTLGISAICFLPLSCMVPLGWLFSIFLGHLALIKIKITNQEGRGMAIAGLVLGYLGIGLILVGVIFLLVLVIFGGGFAYLLTIPFISNYYQYLQ